MKAGVGANANSYTTLIQTCAEACEVASAGRWTFMM
jgi:hypothetical protein